MNWPQRKGKNAPRWKGGIRQRQHALMLYQPEHPYNNEGYVFVYRLIVEAVLQKYLAPKHPIHHVDGDSTNNVTNNFVVCEDNAYHKLLHVRTEALKATGNANSRKCAFCGEWILPDIEGVNYYKRKRKCGWSIRFVHKKCERSYDKARRASKTKGGEKESESE